MPYIAVGNQSLQYKLRRSSRAKRLHLVFRDPDFEIVAPKGVLNQVALAFLLTQKRWMLRQHTKRQNRAQEMPSIWPSVFLAEETIPYRGESIRLHVKFGAKTSHTYHEDSKCLVLTIDHHKTCVHQVEAQVKALLKEWYHAKAKYLIDATISQYCPLLKRWPNGFTLKQQKTRWGSCGTNDRIHINWLLVCAPPGILEYVVVHELSHLWHRNHGKRFWKKVATVIPDYATYDRWLSKQGKLLLAERL